MYTDTRQLKEIVWRVLLVSGIIGFLAYGVAIYFSKPTIETITTQAPHRADDNRQAQDVKYRGGKNR